MEYKSSWTKHIKNAVIRTICAFGNDFHNLNGGYIILGIIDKQGRPVLPPQGLDRFDLEKIQQEIRVSCKRIIPEYQPIMWPTEYREKSILIIQVPGGDTRPYKAPSEVNKRGSKYFYYIRIGAETIKAKNNLQTQLMELAAKVPFDDRQNLETMIEDISPILVRRFLRNIQSELIY
ncbi:MAG: ATP-binding protein [Candidatus Thermoplasmatota archaeon]|jgi:ATP-dependent DNA helicase RecG|nr:ATP-binding protein [Candidatus Thermoplasmatota archaeon]